VRTWREFSCLKRVSGVGVNKSSYVLIEMCRYHGEKEFSHVLMRFCWVHKLGL
jgi:hypothetical protein